MTKDSSTKWYWPAAFVFWALVLSVVILGSFEIDRQQASEEAAWNRSPEKAFRFCLSTAAGSTGTASAEQIKACKDATK